MKAIGRMWMTVCCCLTLSLALAGCGYQGDGQRGSDTAGDGFDLSCQPGDQKQEDCNTCQCQSNGRWACTEIACGDTGAGGDDGSSGADERCQPGDQKQVSCNSCTCQQNGYWACTEIACADAGTTDPNTPADAGSNVQCQDGDEMQRDCNTCTCHDGAWACTEMYCGDAYEPCGDKACGETCTACDPNDPNCDETSVIKYCQPDGSCQATQPSCDPQAECQSDSDCVVSGCSGQVCAADAQATTCEWRDEYACYQNYGDCGCNNGSCGWAQTEELQKCLGD